MVYVEIEGKNRRGRLRIITQISNKLNWKTFDSRLKEEMAIVDVDYGLLATISRLVATGEQQKADD